MCLFRITIRIPSYETPCTKEASDSHFNGGQVMLRSVTFAAGM